MRRVILSVVGSVLCVALSPPASFGADSCTAPCPTPPKTTHSVSAVGLPIPAYPAPLLPPVTLLKAKPKRVLMVEAMVTNAPYGPAVLGLALALAVDVNGIVLNPPGAGVPPILSVAEDCSTGEGTCTVAGTWWLDLDDPANAALFGSPPPLLLVTLVGGDLVGGGVGTLADVTINVRLQKK